MKLKRIFATAVAGVLCLSLAACGEAAQSSSESGDAPVKETTVTLTESWEFTAGFYPVLTASNSNDTGSTYWGQNFYNTLVSYDENGEIQGELATDWDISEDGLTYTFTLRDGVKFSDGTDLTASAVKSSFEGSIQNLGPYLGSYGKVSAIIDSMEAPDDKTFVMTLTQPYYATLNDLTMCNPMAIVNPAAFSQDQTPYEICAEQTMGTGPYMYAGDFDGTTYTFVRNPYYWGEAPEVDSFKIKVIEDNDAKVLALRNGEIDAILGTSCLSYDAYSELSGDSAFGTAVDEAGTMTRYLGLNLSKAPFDNILVRQAIAYALDKETLCASVFQGIEQPAETLFAADEPYCDVDQTTYAYDLAKANEFMDEAGWLDSDGDGIREMDGQKLEFTMIYYTQIGSMGDAVLAIADQLAEIGFKITTNGTDMMTWYSAVGSGDYDMSMCQTYGGAYDPSTVMTNMNPDLGADPIVMQVASFLEDGNALILELDSTSDPARVQEIYSDVLGTVAGQVLMIPVSYTREYAAWNSEVMMGYDFYPGGRYINVAGIHIG